MLSELLALLLLAKFEHTVPPPDTYPVVQTAAPVAPEWLALEAATFALGAAYQPNAASPDAGFDCSGLTHWVYQQAGIDLPRTTYGQLQDSTPTDKPKPGDLVFFSGNSHVGIVAHDGWFIHAENYGKGVTVDALDDPYWNALITGYGSVTSEMPE